MGEVLFLYTCVNRLERVISLQMGSFSRAWHCSSVLWIQLDGEWGHLKLVALSGSVLPCILAYSALSFPAQLCLDLVFLAIVTISFPSLALTFPSTCPLFSLWRSPGLQFALIAASSFSLALIFFTGLFISLWSTCAFIVFYAVLPLLVSAFEFVDWMAECSSAQASEPYHDPSGWLVEPNTRLLLK